MASKRPSTAVWCGGAEIPAASNLSIKAALAQRGHDGLEQKITFREMRTSGVRDALIYCRDYTYSHHIGVSADRDYLILTRV
jgi:hypothetical protein